MIDDRRKSAFSERLSLIVVIIAAFGAFGVLLDPIVTLDILGQEFKFGGDGFSSELKGAVITIMLIGGWQGVMGFWFGNSDSSKQQGQSIARIAEQQGAIVPEQPKENP